MVTRSRPSYDESCLEGKLRNCQEKSAFIPSPSLLSQVTPVKPDAHRQEKVSPLFEHVAPFWHGALMQAICNYRRRNAISNFRIGNKTDR